MPWEDGKIRYVGKGTVALADGREVPVVAALVLKLDPETVPSFTHDRHTTGTSTRTPTTTSGTPPPAC